MLLKEKIRHLMTNDLQLNHGISEGESFFLFQLKS